MDNFYLVNAFSDDRFGGNPAAVCIMNGRWPNDDVMLKMAQQHNQSETAFIRETDETGVFDIRWFTSQGEVDLCGHATMAASHVIFDYIEKDIGMLTLQTREVGDLKIRRDRSLITMDLPLREGKKVELDRKDVAGYLTALGKSITAVDAFEIDRDIYFVLDSEEAVRRVNPDFKALSLCEKWVGVTAVSNTDGYDCVSRFFTPGDSHEEDPVTGSAHCTIAPYWAEKLNKDAITAFQASARGGVLECMMNGYRVEISGHARTYLKGNVLD